MTIVKIRPMVALAIVFAAALSSHRVAAESDDAATAARLFDEGIALVDRGEHAAASEKFEQSFALERLSITAYNLASCYQKVGRIASAWHLFIEAEKGYLADAARAPDPATRDDAKRSASFAAGRAGELAPRLPHLVIRLRSPDPQAAVMVTRDGVPVPPAELGVPVPVDPGAHEVRASAAGYEDVDVRVDVLEAETAAVEVPSLVPLPAPPTSTPLVEPPAHPWWSRPAVIYSVGGVGVASVATGLTFGTLAWMRKRDAVKLGCDFSTDPGTCQSTEAKAVADRARTFSHVSTAAVAAGTVLVGAALVAYLLAPDEASSMPVPFVTGDGAGVAWLIDF